MSDYSEVDYGKSFNLKTWKFLLPFLKPYRRYIFIMLAGIITTSAVDSVQPFLTGKVIDEVIVPGRLTMLPRLIFLYAGLILLQGTGIFVFIYNTGKLRTGFVYQIRKAAFAKLQTLSFSYYDKTQVGWLMARMTGDANRLSEMLAWGVIDLVWISVALILMSTLMLLTNWKLALITLAVMPFLTVLGYYFQKLILNLFRQVRKINSKITGSFNENILGAATTKSLAWEENSNREFAGLAGSFRKAAIKSAAVSSFFMPMVMAIGTIGVSAALWRGGLLYAGGFISSGALIAFIFAAVQLFDPIRELARVLSQFQAAHASAERVASLLASEPEIAVDGEMGPPIKGDIEFRDVDFHYIAEEPIFTNFSLKVNAGEKVGVVGSTGSGKSSLVNLICRFYEPKRGTILIDGHDYKNFSPDWLHQNLGYVLQTPHLFSGTVRENIRYGNLTADDAAVEEAARMVKADSFIRSLSNGYETLVEEGGARLSLGERQLISFARAMLADPAFFILDEATSSIDVETEQKIQGAVEAITKERTSFIIAHRLSTIQDADRILVLENGKIVEEGKHDDLMARKGHYFLLYIQYLKEKDEDKLMQ